MTDKKYIEREAAKNILLQHQHRFTCADEANGYGSVKWSEDVIYISEAVNGMDDIPAADVRPVVRGKWVLEYEPNGKPYCFHCSVCDGDFHYIGITTKYDFCPNCGAEMEES